MNLNKFNPWLNLLLRLLAVLGLFSLSRAIFYFFNTDLFGVLESREWLNIILGGIRFDVVAVLYINLLYILIITTPLIRNTSINKIADVIFVISNSVGLLLNCIDTAYYEFNLKRMTWTSLGELKDFNNAGALFSSFLVDYWYVWAIWIIFIALLFLIVRKIQPKHKLYGGHTYVDLFLLTIILSIIGFRGDLRYSTRPLGLNDAGQYVESPQNVALIFSTPFSIFRTVSEQKINPYNYFSDEKELESVFNPVYTVPGEGDFKPMNVIILVLESFSEVASSISNTDTTTNRFMPFVDSLRRQSFYSEYSLANGKKSIEALPTIWGSIPSYSQPYVLSKYASNHIYGLPKILKDKGYHTSFFHGAPNGSMGFVSFSHIMGIDHYYGKDEFNNNSEFDGIWGIWDQPFMQYFGETIKTFPEPFMSTIFTISSHDPFKVPKGLEDQYPDGPHPIYKTYAYSDDAVRQFFDQIKDEPWYKNTLFVFTADHTAPKITQPEFSTSLGRFRVPVFFYAPGLELPGKSDRIFQQADIMPTVLDLLNYKEPFVTFGKNLLDSTTLDFGVNKYENYQYLYEDFLLKLNGDNEPVGLYRYKEDKLLEHNIISQQESKAANLSDRFRGYIQQFQNRLIEDRFIAE